VVPVALPRKVGAARSSLDIEAAIGEERTTARSGLGREPDGGTSPRLLWLWPFGSLGLLGLWPPGKAGISVNFMQSTSMKGLFTAILPLEDGCDKSTEYLPFASRTSHHDQRPVCLGPCVLGARRVVALHAAEGHVCGLSCHVYDQGAAVRR